MHEAVLIPRPCLPSEVFDCKATIERRASPCAASDVCVRNSEHDCATSAHGNALCTANAGSLSCCSCIHTRRGRNNRISILKSVAQHWQAAVSQCMSDVSRAQSSEPKYIYLTVSDHSSALPSLHSLYISALHRCLSRLLTRRPPGLHETRILDRCRLAGLNDTTRSEQAYLHGKRYLTEVTPSYKTWCVQSVAIGRSRCAHTYDQVLREHGREPATLVLGAPSRTRSSCAASERLRPTSRATSSQ